MLKLRR